MTIIETVLVVSVLINLMLLLFVINLFINMVNVKVFVNQIHSGIGTTLNRVTVIEQVLTKLGINFAEFVKMMEGVVDKISVEEDISQIYRTADGRYSAKSIDELIKKIKNSDEASEYFSEEELDRLKGLFETDSDLFDEDDED